MPGTGHSARYKGSISNRVRTSPFEQLANWNAQLLGADGMIPSITGGGGSLEFKKLNASDIDGVMHNPATENLDMNSFGIVNNQQLETSSILFSPPLSTANYGAITSNTNGITVNTNSPYDFRATVGRDVIMTVANDITMRAVGDINFGPFTTDTTAQKISIGNTTGAQQNKEVSIMFDGTYSGAGNFLRLGRNTITATQIASLATTILGVNTLTLNGGNSTGTLTLGNTSTGLAGLTSEITTVLGTVRLNLVSDPSTPGTLGVHIGQSGDKIGFFGHGPITRPDVELTSPADTALERSTKINNFMIKMSDQIGGGLGLITTSGP
jgi:hypothetical protein